MSQVPPHQFLTPLTEELVNNRLKVPVVLSKVTWTWNTESHLVSIIAWAGFSPRCSCNSNSLFFVVSPQKVTIYQSGDGIVGASFDTVLDGIDASYCTAAGGDVSPYDPIYPDHFNSGEGLTGYLSKDCGKFTPASVISISYSSNENLYPTSYVTRMCNE